MEWSFEEGSILYRQGKYTPTREIFQAVCDELGRYYSARGFKYTKSGRKLRWKGKHLKYVIGFCSSHYNTSGDYILLEICEGMSAINQDGMERKGVLSFEFNRLKAPADATKIIVYKIDGTILEREPVAQFEEGLVIYSNSCNIYGIDLVLFEKIIHYIDGIIEKMQQMETKEGIDNHLKLLTERYVDYFWKYDNNLTYYKFLEKNQEEKE